MHCGHPRDHRSFPRHDRDRRHGARCCMIAGLAWSAAAWRRSTTCARGWRTSARAREQPLDGAYPAEVQPLVDDLNAPARTPRADGTRARRQGRRSRARIEDAAGGARAARPSAAEAAGPARARRGDRAAGRTHAPADRLSPGACARGRVRGDGRRALLGRGLGRRRSRAPAAPPRRPRPDDRRAGVAPITSCAGQREDLDEMLGNLLDNACKWARSQRRRHPLPAPTSRDRRSTVDDDGPGLDPIDARGGAAARRAGRRSGAWIRARTGDRARSRGSCTAVRFRSPKRLGEACARGWSYPPRIQLAPRPDSAPDS